MKQFRLLCLFLGLTCFGTLSAQDIHYSLFNMSPLTLNPALTGAFSGTARVGGIYRDQWASFLDNQFVTPSFYVDAPIIRGFRKNDWIGVGGMIVSDEAGSAELSNTASMLSGAYHMAMNKKATTILTLGIQGGSVQRRINMEKLLFGDALTEELQNGQITPSTDLNKIRDNVSYIDFAVGLLLRTFVSNETNFEIGAAVSHLTQPRYSLLSTGSNTDEGKRPLTALVHARLNTDISDKWRLSPTAFFQTTSGGGSEISLQGWGGYYLRDNKEIVINFGLGYRVGDSGKVLGGLDYKDLRVALAYDVTLSSLNNVNNYQGGWEIAAYYIIKIFKKPNVKPAILCPKF